MTKGLMDSNAHGLSSGASSGDTEIRSQKATYYQIVVITHFNWYSSNELWDLRFIHPSTFDILASKCILNPDLTSELSEMNWIDMLGPEDVTFGGNIPVKLAISFNSPFSYFPSNMLRKSYLNKWITYYQSSFFDNI